MPKVSVIMSVYNGEKYLKEAIESILNQTFRDFEFIIVDDGSTDKTPEILNEYAKKDKRIKIITNPKNIGLTKSLNKALKIAKGEYIARMDADDISLPERLKKQVNFLTNYPNFGLVGCNVIVIDEKGNFVKNVTLPESLNSALRKRNRLVHGSVMFRKSLVKKIGGYNEKIFYAQDYEMFLRFSKISEIGRINEFLYKLRVHKSSLSYKKFFKQMYYVALAKTKVLFKKDKYSLRFFYELLYSFVFIYKLGLPMLLRRMKIIK